MPTVGHRPFRQTPATAWRFSWLAAAAISSGCATSAMSADTVPSIAAPGQTSTADALARVRAAIGDAACSSDSQCRTVAIGQKACGGPDAYLAWSSQHTDEGALKEAVAAFDRAQSQAAAKRDDGRMSNCLFVADPGARCMPAPSGRACQLLRAGARAAP